MEKVILGKEAKRLPGSDIAHFDLSFVLAHEQGNPILILYLQKEIGNKEEALNRYMSKRSISEVCVKGSGCLSFACYKSQKEIIISHFPIKSKEKEHHGIVDPAKVLECIKTFWEDYIVRHLDPKLYVPCTEWKYTAAQQQVLLVQ